MQVGIELTEHVVVADDAISAKPGKATVRRHAREHGEHRQAQCKKKGKQEENEAHSQHEVVGLVNDHGVSPAAAGVGSGAGRAELAVHAGSHRGGRTAQPAVK